MSKTVRPKTSPNTRLVRQAIVYLLLAAFPFQQALPAASGTVLPSGGNFTAGSGTIATSANAVVIHQASSHGIIDWSKFSIGSGGRVLFVNGAGATLNRVTGDQMSLILGSLQSTGSIYLINPQGVLIGPAGRVYTGGDFVASTLNLPENSFFAGGALVFSGNSPAMVKNLGTVSSTGGNIFLIASQVTNRGSLTAPNGSVGLAAGGEVLLKDSNSDQRIFVNAAGADVTNSGVISAAQVELKANGGNVFALAGNSGGQIRATGTGTRDGHVWLISAGGTTTVSGLIAATNWNGSGGAIETSGAHVTTDGAKIATGKGGNWLLDPVDLTIDSSAAATIQTALTGGTNVTESTSASGSSGSGSVNSSGSGDILVNSGISWNSAAALTLSAYRNITVATGVTIANAGSGTLTLQADNAATGTGTVSFTGTGSVHFTGAGNVDLFYHPSGYPTATSYSGNVSMGSGVFTPYMTVDTAANLQAINTGISPGGDFALNTNIDASSISNFAPIGSGANWNDGAGGNQGFSGIFDGRYHTISNLTVSATTKYNNYGDGAGLFAQIGSSGIVRNVGLTNESITSNVDYANVGGLAGTNYGSITSSYTAGSASSTGNTEPFVGGLVGDNEGSISNTYSLVHVSLFTNYSAFSAPIGGLVGINSYSNFNNMNTANGASITNSLSTGHVTTSGMGSWFAGSFVGQNYGVISSSYYDSTIAAADSRPGVADAGSISPVLTGETTATLKSGTLPSGLSSTYWFAPSNAYPELSWQAPSGITVTGTVYNGTTPVGSGVTVVGLANGAPFGSTTTNSSGAYTLTAPTGTTSVLDYLTSSYTGNTFSNYLNVSFSAVNIYAGSLRLINATSSTYSGILTALSSALGGNSGSNFLFSMSDGMLSLKSSQNFVVMSSVATTIDQSIAGTGTVLLDATGSLTLSNSATVSASGTGTPLTLVSGGAFINSVGSGALSTSGGGRWLVYSQNPANDTPGSLSHAFKQYNATYGSTAVAANAGNGLLYTTAPILTPGLTGTAVKTYDSLNTATVSSANLTSTGHLTGDTVTLSATAATYANQNAGNSKSVTATGISATAVDGSGAVVYGYQLASTSASGAIGSINAASLTYTADTASRSYGSVNPSFSGTVAGFVGSDTQANATGGSLGFSSPATSGSNAGSFGINGSGLTANNGNYTFQQAAGNSTALTINPALLTYAAATASRTYGSNNPTFAGTVTGLVNEDTLSNVTTGTAAFGTSATAASNTGIYAINGSGLSTSNGNYTLQQAAGNATAFTINPALLTYTATTAARTYGDANPTFAGSVTGFVLTDTQQNATIGTLGFGSSASTSSNTGNYAINGSGLTANNGNYTFQQAEGNTTALSINPALLTYTASSASRTYGAADPTFAGSVSGFVLEDTQQNATTGALAFSASSASDAGTYAINGSGLTANNGNYTFQQAAGNATAFTINPALLTYAAATASRTYGSNNPSFAGTVTGLVNEDTLSNVTTGTAAFGTGASSASNTGIYAINGSGLSTSNGNYTLQQAAGNATAFTINPALLTYTATTAARAYGAANPTFAGSLTGFVLTDTQQNATIGTLGFGSSASTSSNTGNYAINGSGLTANNGNYTFQQAEGNTTALSINPALLTYTATTASRTYGAANPTFGGSVSGFVLEDTQQSATTGALAFSASSASDAGTYAINGSGLTANNGNYTFQQAVGNATAFTINPALLTYTAGTASRTYGSANPTFTGTVTGLVNEDTLSNVTTGTAAFGTGASSASNTGIYAINGSGLSTSNGNYTLQQAAGNSTAFTINPALLTYAATTAARAYGAANPLFAGSVTGFVLADTQQNATAGTLGFGSSATTASNTGTYAINGSGLTANNGNYTFQQAEGNTTALSINPALLTYTATTASRTYGAANPTFGGSVTGFVNSDTQNSATVGTLGFGSAATSGSSAGSYAVNGSGLTADNGNYTFQQAVGNATAFTINPALLTYTAGTASRTYGSANPTFTGTVTGLVNEDTLSNVTTGSAAFGTGATAASNTGIYAINGSGLSTSNGNYTFQQAAGNATAFTINPALLTYAATTAARTYGAANPTFAGIVTGFVLADTQQNATAGTLGFGSSASTASNTGTYAINGSGLTANNGNYTFQQAEGNTTALSINPALLTYTATTASRTYGAANPTFGGSVTGFVSSDTQNSATVGTLGFGSAATSGSSAGSYAVNGSGLTADNGNYTFQQAAGNATAFTINPALLTYTAGTAARTYGSANPTFTGTVTGLVNEDTLSNVTTGSAAFGTGATAASNTGIYAINGSGLSTSNGNYTFQQAAGNATAFTINPALLTYSAATAARTYGAANPLFAGSVTGFVLADTQQNATAGTLGFGSSATTASNTGNYAINGSGLTANNGNYTFLQAEGNSSALTINPASLLYTATTASRTYGATNPAFTGSITGLVNDDTLASVTSGSAIFGSGASGTSGVGTYAINGSGLSVIGGNYNLQQASQNAGALTIHPAQLTASVLANGKVYDATNSATGQIGALAGILNGDSISVSTANTSYKFADKNAGTGKAVSEAGATLTGAEAVDYTLTVAPGFATITPAALLASSSAVNKIYDATTAASGQIAALSGILGNDKVTLNATSTVFNFADKNVGTGKTVSETGAVLSGLDASNYTLTVKSASANITPANVVTSISASNKVYDGTAIASGSLGPLTGVLGNDAVTVNAAAAYLFQTPSAGNNKTVTETGALLAGADAGNYQLTVQNGAANVTPEPVTLTIGNVVRPAGAPNPAFPVSYAGPPLAGVDLSALLATVTFKTGASAASMAGIYQITGTSNYPNLSVTILPGTLQVTSLGTIPVSFTDTPQVDPSVASAKPLTAAPLQLNDLTSSFILAPNSLGLLQVGYSSDWSALLGTASGGPPPLASASFLIPATSDSTYQGGIRPW